ncbi:MAG: alpha/beta hydrolase [Alphaproteobacteria bacterium]|nr:alpha/beta hydrolase [Alphaproteobacteria bacterium]
MGPELIRVGDINLNYMLSGPPSSPVVCLNHCFASDHRYWDFHLPAFEGFRVLRHDARGHGGSDAPPGPYSLSMMAADAVGLMDALEIDRVHLCGVSMGGMISQTVALDFPDRVASLALVNTTSEYTEDQMQAWRDRSDAVLRDGMEAVRAPLMDRWLTDAAAASRSPTYIYMEDAIARFTAASFVAASAAMCGLYTTPRLSEIQAPTIVIATPDDPGVPTVTSELMARTLGAPLHWLEPARHLASLEHVERFNVLMQNFLAGVLRS